jgi:hypothetical protein
LEEIQVYFAGNTGGRERIWERIKKGNGQIRNIYVIYEEIMKKYTNKIVQILQLCMSLRIVME